MVRHFASVFAIATTTAAIAGVAAIGSSQAYAETPTIDNRPFVSTRARAEVQAEVMRDRAIVSAGASEWAMQHNYVPQLNSGYTRAQAQSEYQAARHEVSAMNSEDSGSSYVARKVIHENAGIAMAGGAR